MSKKEVRPKHPILDKIAAVNKDYVTASDWEHAPHDRRACYEYWWDKYARNCQNCVLSETRLQVVKPDGVVGEYPQIMILGEGPGVMEDATGLPMVSPMVLRASRCGRCAGAPNCYSHKMLDRPDSRHPRNKEIVCQPKPTNTEQLASRFYIQSAGSIVDGILLKKWKFNYPRQSWLDHYNRLHEGEELPNFSPWFVTNTVLCRSMDPLTKRDKPPGTAPKAICKKWMVWQWAMVQPVVTIVLGVPALEAMTMDNERSKVITGEIFEGKKFGPIIFNSHPAHIMREENVSMQALQFARLGRTFETALRYAGYPVD